MTKDQAEREYHKYHKHLYAHYDDDCPRCGTNMHDGDSFTVVQDYVCKGVVECPRCRTRYIWIS